MHKITQFGQIFFSQLTFPPHFPQNLVSLIGSLVVSRPEQRLGSSSGGMEALKQHEYFAGVKWNEVSELSSPLAAYAEEMRVEGLSEGIPSDITARWEAEEMAPWMEELRVELEER